MLDKTINLLEEIDSISKIHFLKRDDIDEIMIEFSRRILVALKIERISVWLFNPEGDAIVSMGEYDLRTHGFAKNTSLSKEKHPSYFEAIGRNKILLVENTYTNKSTKEFTDDYLTPNDIISLMDIPLRISGELIGVICFEKTGKIERSFDENEQSFAFSIALVLASNLEARHRRAAQSKLETALQEKDLLMTEINHRVKNNFSILISLLRIRKLNSKSAETKAVLEEYEQCLFSMMKIQDLLIQSKNYTSVVLSNYLNELLKEFKMSYPEMASQIQNNIPASKQTLATKTALHLGLLLTEIFINSVKYAFHNTANYKFTIEIVNAKNTITLKIGDNSEGFDFSEKEKLNTLGLHLIKDLSEDFGAKTKFPSIGNCYYEFTLEV